MCSVCSLRIIFNIDFSFSEMRRLYWIKSINAYTFKETVAQEKRGGKSSLKELWKFQVVFTIFIFFINKKLLKSYQNCFSFYQKSSFCPRDFQTFLFPSSPLFFFLGHCSFYRRSWLMKNSKVYDIIMSLNWMLITQIL